MSLQNFIPEVWSEKMLDDLDKLLVFKENCNHEYEGKVRGVGDSVMIPVMGDVVTHQWNDGKLHTLDKRDKPEGSTLFMPVNHVSWFNFGVGTDLDKAQANGGKSIMAKYTKKASEKQAGEMDSFIAKLHVGDCLNMGTNAQKFTVSPDGRTGTTAILDAIDDMYLMLLENNVSRNTTVTLTASPWFINMLKRAYVDLDTNNSEMLKNGRVGKYGGIILKESNNCFLGEDGFWHFQMKTNDAIAFVNPHTHTEGYRPDDEFEDYVKGYTLYDGKMIAPKQCVDLICKKAV